MKNLAIMAGLMRFDDA